MSNEFVVSFIFDSFDGGNFSYGLNFVNKFLDIFSTLDENHTDILFGDVLSEDRPYNFHKLIDKQCICSVPLTTHFEDYAFSISCLNLSKEKAEIIQNYLIDNCLYFRGVVMQNGVNGFINMLINKIHVDEKEAYVYCYPEQEGHPFDSCFANHGYSIAIRYYGE